MKIALIIIGCIILLLLILLFSPIRVYIEYLGGKPKVVLKYLFYGKTLVGGQKKPKTQKKKAKKKTKKNDSKKKADKKEKEETKEKSGLLPDSLGGKIDFILELVKLGGRALRKLLRRILIKDIIINFTISDEDACECALKFGKTNIIVYNAFSALSCFLRLRKKSIQIKCVYNKPDCIYDTSFTICITPGALIAIALGFAFAFLKLVIKTKKAEKLKDEEKEADTREIEDNNDNKAA